MDSQNNIQGPFSSLEMDKWFKKGFLTKELIIAYKKIDLDCFFKLKELLNPNAKKEKNLFFRSFMKKSQSVNIKLQTCKN